MVLMGCFGYLMMVFRFPAPPFLIAFILGPLPEDNFRQSMILSEGGSGSWLGAARPCVGRKASGPDRLAGVSRPPLAGGVEPGPALRARSCRQPLPGEGDREHGRRGTRMSTIVFDTHAFVKELTEAGMPEAQAEVLARSQANLIDEKLATKEDLKALELRLKHDLTMRLGAMMAVAVGVVAALAKLL